MKLAMKSIGEWFEEYAESRCNPTNKSIHWVCVPVITYTLLGLLWALNLYALLEFFWWRWFST